MSKLQLSYFTGEEVEQFTFLRLPKLLFTDERFQEISNDCKLLYSFMLDRVSLSISNNWRDKEGRIYIIYTVEEASQLLGKTTRSVSTLMRQLGKDTGIGLIERKKQGLGKPDLIYVKNFASLQEISEEVSEENMEENPVENPVFSGQEEKILPLQTGKSFTSRQEKFSGLEEKKIPPIKTYQTNTNQNQTDVLKPTLPPNPKPTFPQLLPTQERTDGWRDLDREEKSYQLCSELEMACHNGKEDVATLLYQYRGNEEKVELALDILLGMEEREQIAVSIDDYSSQKLHFQTTKLYARALTEMLTSNKLTNVKGACISYAKVIEKLAPHVKISGMTYKVELDNIVSSTVMAYMEANKVSEIKSPLPYMKSCIWSTLCEGNIRDEANFHYHYG